MLGRLDRYRARAREAAERRQKEEEARRLNEEQERLAREAEEAQRRIEEQAAAGAIDPAAQQAAAQAEAAAAQAAALAETAREQAEQPASKTVVRTDLGVTASERSTWEFEITDPAQVPAAYCSPDPAKIKAAVKAGVRSIAGVRIFEHIQTVVR